LKIIKNVCRYIGAYRSAEKILFIITLKLRARPEFVLFETMATIPHPCVPLLPGIDGWVVRIDVFQTV
jgi:hypothetical protein